MPKSCSEEVIVEGILGKDIVKTEEKVVDNITEDLENISEESSTEEVQ